MHIHFVCTGNVYRSRLAEAYLNSHSFPGISVTSSGTAAVDNTCGPICWYAQRLMEACHLIPFMSPMWTQTTADSFNGVDVTVFMEPMHHTYAVEQCGFAERKYLVWNIPDLDELQTLEVEETVEAVRISQETYGLIKKCVDDLIVELNLKNPA